MTDTDFKIEVVDPQPYGGQRVGICPTKIRITHIPTGIEVAFDGYRSQLRNKNKAMEYLKFILEYEACSNPKGG